MQEKEREFAKLEQILRRELAHKENLDSEVAKLQAHIEFCSKQLDVVAHSKEVSEKLEELENEWQKIIKRKRREKRKRVPTYLQKKDEDAGCDPMTRASLVRRGHILEFEPQCMSCRIPRPKSYCVRPKVRTQC